MEDSSQTEVEVDLYEEIVNLNYSTPTTSRALSLFAIRKTSQTLLHSKSPIPVTAK